MLLPSLRFYMWCQTGPVLSRFVHEVSRSVHLDMRLSSPVACDTCVIYIDQTNQKVYFGWDHERLHSTSFPRSYDYAACLFCPGLLTLAALQSLMVSPQPWLTHTGLRVAVRMHTERAASSLSSPALCADPPTILPPALWLTPQGPP